MRLVFISYFGSVLLRKSCRGLEYKCLFYGLHLSLLHFWWFVLLSLSVLWFSCLDFWLFTLDFLVFVDCFVTHMSFFKSLSITFFASFFISMLRITNLFFVFKNKNCYYHYRFYHGCAFKLIDWLIWFVHKIYWFI